jgi:hypothetical protein
MNIKHCSLAVALLCAVSVEAIADTILVGAPIFNNFSSWVSQSGVPPSGPVFNHADQFSLTSAQNVTTLHVSLYGTATVAPAPFELALVDSLTSATPIQSAIFNAPSTNTLTDFALSINSELAAGTYFIRVTTNGFIGWGVADATQFVTTHGTIFDGIWQQPQATGIWSSQSSGGNTSVSFPHPGIFAVLGPEVPEPGSALLLLVAAGFLGLAAARRTTSERSKT